MFLVEKSIILVDWGYPLIVEYYANPSQIVKGYKSERVDCILLNKLYSLIVLQRKKVTQTSHYAAVNISIREENVGEHDI